MRKLCLGVFFVLTACAQPAVSPVAAAPSPSSDAPANASKGSAPGTALVPMPAVTSATHASPSPSPNPSPAPNPSPSPTPTPKVLHTHCGWIGAGDPIGEASFIANAAQFDYVHPKWFTIDTDGLGVHAVGNVDLATVLAAAKTSGTRVMPLIDSDSVNDLRKMLSTPASIAAHVQTLVNLVETHGYAGLDVDYEHLWQASDRAPFTSFVQQLAAGLHAAGAELSFAIPGMGADDGNNGFDYAAMSAAADALHVMGYDFHWVEGDHLGPVAPAGWIDDVFKLAGTTGHGDKFILGVANYAIGAGWWTTANAATAQCLATPATVSIEMQSCPYTHYDAGRVQHCTTARGDLWFEDVQSMEDKLLIARSHGARGITYWTIGDELPGYFKMVAKYYP